MVLKIISFFIFKSNLVMNLFFYQYKGTLRQIDLLSCLQDLI